MSTNAKTARDTWPIGFSASGLSAGVSHKKNKKDLALFYSHFPANGAAVFTSNRVKAAPIIHTHDKFTKTRGHVRAIAVNSGRANAATGKDGLKDAKICSSWVSAGLGVPDDQVWLASTGVIGQRIPMRPYKAGLKKLIHRIKTSTEGEGHLAARAIMTTDTKPKTADLIFYLDDVPVRMWGCAKGSGMIHPDLRGPRGVLHATMLGFILTDANVPSRVLQRALEKITDKSFNCLSIDGDTSTNDFVGVMANGASGAPAITSLQSRNYKTLCRALFEVSDRLTTQLAMDGEGATRLVQIFVEGARTEKSARQMASVIASSPLVKTACHGADPNWGRVLMSLGRSGVPFDPKKVNIWLGDLLVCKHGQEIPFSEKQAIQYMKKSKIVIRVNLGLGHQWSRYKTCDFTGHYVGINAGYRT